jgi:hypothetical protein
MPCRRENQPGDRGGERITRVPAREVETSTHGKTMNKVQSLILLLFLAACAPILPGPVRATPTSWFRLTLPPKWTETVTPTVTDTPTLTFTREGFLNGMLARPPSGDELKNLTSLWTLVHYRELMEPGSESYYLFLPNDSAWLWDWSFCALGGYFSDYIHSIDIGFYIDAQPLEEGRHLLVRDAPGADEWTCRYWSTVLVNWPKDRAVSLEIRYSSRVDVDDGKYRYRAGEYSQLIMILPET